MADKEIALELYKLYFGSSNTMPFELFMNQFTEMVYLVKHGKSIKEMSIVDNIHVRIDAVTYKRDTNTVYLRKKKHHYSEPSKDNE